MPTKQRALYTSVIRDMPDLFKSELVPNYTLSSTLKECFTFQKLEGTYKFF